MVLSDILYFIGGAELANQIAYSDLSFKLKHLFFFIDKDGQYPQKLSIFSHLKSWRKLLDKLFYLFLIMIIPIWILINIHKLLSELLSCNECTAMWTGAIINYYIIDMSLIDSLLLAPLYIILAVVLNRIK